MQRAHSPGLALLLLLGCAGAAGVTANAGVTADEPSLAEQEPLPAPAPSAWLGALSGDGMLVYEVSDDSGPPRTVRMLVQQRVSHGASVAIRLAPIGTPLGETPVYPRWLVGSPDALRALEEHAGYTVSGFLPIDEEGRLVTEAASAEAWCVHAEWLRSDRSASGREAAAGWTLLERVGTIEEPLHAERCVRLERSEGSGRTTLLICADTGMVELRRSEGEQDRERWRLVSIGERPSGPSALE